MNRRPSIGRNVLSNWVSLGTSVACAFVLTPIVVRALDTERYGIWSFLNGLLAYSDLLYLGLGSALIRYVAQARADRDQARVNRLTSVVVSIYSALGLLGFLVFAAVSGIVPALFAEPLSAATSRSASHACTLLGLRLMLAFVSSGFSGLLCGYERFDFVNGVGVVSAIARLVATLVVVPSAADPLLAMALIACGAAVMDALSLAGIAFWYVPQLSIRFVRPALKETSVLYRFGIQSFFVLLAFKLISYTDTTVIGLRLGAASVALYSLPLQIVEYVRLSVSSFTGVFLPRLTLLSAREDVRSLRETYLSSTRITCFLAGWLGALAIALGPRFLDLWVGPEFGRHATAVLVLLTISAFASATSTQAPFPFYQALNLVSRPAAVLTAEAALNLGLSIWLAPRLGIAGVALATAIPAVLVSLVLLPPFMCRRLELPVTTLIASGVAPGVVMLLLTLAVEWVVTVVSPAHSYLHLLACACTSAPLAIALVAVTFPASERRSIVDAVRRLRRNASKPF
jgi:O-antigen/teichoic acid export membrane protein